MKLNSSDEANEEEKMLKRTIAMSLEKEKEQEEEEPSSIKGELLKIKAKKKLGCDESFLNSSWHRGGDASHLASFRE